jgi:8-oxo-dGTP pyrophosphatase MutT (NUDIX family)
MASSSNARVAALVAAHVPADAKEAADLRIVVRMLAGAADIMSPSHAAGHVTGSALVVDAGSGRFLLHRHRTLGRWLQVGGHADPGEDDPAVTALREAHEETGLADLRFLREGPIDIDVHEIPARPDRAAHLHLDFRYALVTDDPRPGGLAAGESAEFAWLTLDDLAPRGIDVSPALRRLIGKTLEAFAPAR